MSFSFISSFIRSVSYPAVIAHVFFVTGVIADFEILHCGNRDFALFCYCNLDLDPTTFIFEPDPYPLKAVLSLQIENELSTSRLSKLIVIRTHRQTYRQTPPKTLPRRFAVGNNEIHIFIPP